MELHKHLTSIRQTQALVSFISFILMGSICWPLNFRQLISSSAQLCGFAAVASKGAAIERVSVIRRCLPADMGLWTPSPWYRWATSRWAVSQELPIRDREGPWGAEVRLWPVWAPSTHDRARLQPVHRQLLPVALVWHKYDNVAAWVVSGPSQAGRGGSTSSYPWNSCAKAGPASPVDSVSFTAVLERIWNRARGTRIFILFLKSVAVFGYELQSELHFCYSGYFILMYHSRNQSLISNFPSILSLQMTNDFLLTPVDFHWKFSTFFKVLNKSSRHIFDSMLYKPRKQKICLDPTSHFKH